MAQGDRVVDKGWREHQRNHLKLVTAPMVGRYTSPKRGVLYAILRNGKDSTYPTPLRVHARNLQNHPRPLGRALRGKLARRGGGRR
jgi:hypothetical protein